jgi:hypothetical protein
VFLIGQQRLPTYGTGASSGTQPPRQATLVEDVRWGLAGLAFQPNNGLSSEKTLQTNGTLLYPALRLKMKFNLYVFKSCAE